MPDDLVERLDALIATQTALTGALTELARSLGLLAQAMAADDELAEASLPATLDG